MNTIQDNIKKIRKEKGLTQEDLATQLFVTRQLISKWEQGKSLPNIADVERLAIILEVSINDLIDDDSMKSIAITEAITNQKKRKFIWISIFASLIAVALGIYAIFFAYRPLEGENVVIFSGYFYVIEQDNNAGIITFANDDITLGMGYEVADSTVTDIAGEIYFVKDLVVGDNVRITYGVEPDTAMTITVLDHQLETELYGVVIDATGTFSEDLMDIQYIDIFEDIRYAFDSGNNTGWNVEVAYESSADEEYAEITYDVYVYLDPQKSLINTRIGLITSDGIEFVDTVSILSQEIYEYSGAYMSDETNLVTTDTTHVIYRVHICFESSINDITIYEYDKNNDLIHETVLDIEDLDSFTAQDETLYAYVETNETSGTPTGLSSIRNVTILYIGQRLELNIAGDNGIVRKIDFYLD
ncbi:MAG: helix-turn-helix transcriptional regulator [Bacilli bacterium]|nr:helix-turn-helix transcriptional regulator [Bacilli bacterium]